MLWLPVKQAYVATANILAGTFTTTNEPSKAMAFAVDAAELACIYLARQTGMSVALRRYALTMRGRQ